jgi:FkbM family methyltransferase
MSVKTPIGLEKELAVFNRELQPILRKKYPWLSHIDPEVFAFHHGLKRLPEKVVEILKERDTLDIGAYNGDSALVLFNYSRCVYSFEIALDNNAKMERTLAESDVPPGKVRLFHLGMSDHVGSKGLGGAGASQKLTNDGESVEVTTIDRFVAEQNLTVGFIKADVEGHGLDVAKGGRETMIRDRPVLTFAVYHKFIEMYDLSIWLKETLGNYHFEWQMMKAVDVAYFELNLVGYPLEILADGVSRPVQ